MAQSEAVSKVRPWLVLLATCLSVFLVTLDVTIINLALPSIQRDFSVSLVEGSWILNAYTLAFAAFPVSRLTLGLEAHIFWAVFDEQKAQGQHQKKKEQPQELISLPPAGQNQNQRGGGHQN